MADGLDHSISMLGAPTSGKTTFLAALSIALTLDEREQGWNVIGGDPASRQALVDMTLALNQDRSFPLPTPFAIEHYRWLLIGKVRQSVSRRWVGAKRVLKPVRIGLDLADATGGLAHPEQAGNPLREELISNIMKSRGIVFLFDPIGESRSGDSFKYLFSVLAEVAQRMATDDDPDFEGTLPHHVAVCIAKFDELRVLATAEKLNMIRTDPSDRYEFPRIHDDDAREFLLELCRVLNTGNTELVMKTLEKHFRRDRIKYFVTSAIGFYVNPATNEYDPDDIQNVLPDPNDPKGKKIRIRGSIHPINVVEPLMWLAGKLTGLETQ